MKIKMTEKKTYSATLIQAAVPRLAILQLGTPGDILHLLDSEGECTVNAISERIGILQTCVSTFLKKMHRAGFLHCRRDGKYTHYSINYQKMGRIIDNIKVIITK